MSNNDIREMINKMDEIGEARGPSSWADEVIGKSPRNHIVVSDPFERQTNEVMAHIKEWGEDLAERVRSADPLSVEEALGKIDAMKQALESIITSNDEISGPVKDKKETDAWKQWRDRVGSQKITRVGA